MVFHHYVHTPLTTYETSQRDLDELFIYTENGVGCYCGADGPPRPLPCLPVTGPPLPSSSTPLFPPRLEVVAGLGFGDT